MLKDKVFIITGGCRGIGLEIYKMCVENKCKVVICSRDLKQVNKAISLVDPKKKFSLGLKIDISNLDDLKKLVKLTLNTFGKIDVLVNNAGIYGPIGKFEDLDLDMWYQTMSINLLGAVNLSSLIIPVMIKNGGGKIINIAGAGVGSSNIPERFTAYYTSKMALVGFTECLSLETAKDNIQVNCISPGGVNTYFTDYLLSLNKEVVGEKMYKQALTQKDSGGDDPRLTANMVKFLSSSDSNHITGKIISAKWDKIDDLINNKFNFKNIFSLRRIDNTFFYEK